jgi:hypothetical protein
MALRFPCSCCLQPARLVQSHLFFAMKMITINPGSDKTAQKITALSPRARSALENRLPLTEIAGVPVTIHSTKFETAVDRARFSSLNLTNWFSEDLWILN